VLARGPQLERRLADGAEHVVKVLDRPGQAQGEFLRHRQVTDGEHALEVLVGGRQAGAGAAAVGGGRGGGGGGGFGRGGARVTQRGDAVRFSRGRGIFGWRIFVSRTRTRTSWVKGWPLAGW